MSQIKAAEDSGELPVDQFDALLLTGGIRELKRPGLQPLVPDAEAILIPEQDLDPIAVAVEEQKQMARQGNLIENRLGKTHQTVKAAVHIDGR